VGNVRQAASTIVDDCVKILLAMVSPNPLIIAVSHVISFSSQPPSLSLSLLTTDVAVSKAMPLLPQRTSYYPVNNSAAGVEFRFH
jgi:hypothetical protein